MMANEEILEGKKNVKLAKKKSKSNPISVK